MTQFDFFIKNLVFLFNHNLSFSFEELQHKSSRDDPL